MKNKGFTLIELMVTIAILGILAVLAIPAYQDYTVRAKVMEGVNMAAAAKLAVAETTISHSTLPASQAATGYVSPKPTAYVDTIIIGQNGVITIQYNQNIDHGGTMILTPTLHENGEITWICTEGTLAAKYRPANCR